MSADLGDAVYEACVAEANAMRDLDTTKEYAQPVYRWDNERREMVEADPLEALIDKIADNLRSIGRDLELVRADLKRDR